MLLHERLNQCFFIKKISIFKITKDFLNDYSYRLGYSSDVINDFFDKWICTDNEELSFGKYAIIGSNIDDLWENAGILDFEWSLFTSVAKRLTTIGSSEADVERLFSQQKVAMGRHMTTHTQCVLHIIRLRLIIFHTPKIFSRRNIIE